MGSSTGGETGHPGSAMHSSSRVPFASSYQAGKPVCGFIRPVTARFAWAGATSAVAASRTAAGATSRLNKVCTDISRTPDLAATCPKDIAGAAKITGSRQERESANARLRDLATWCSPATSRRHGTISPVTMADSHDLIRVHGARVNNLKDVSVEIPKRRLTVFTGVSGSGKSSLVFGTIAAESQRLINETYSTFVQGFMPTLARPEVDVLDGLTTAILVDQERMGSNPRSTV